jgi:hypothetical protein
MTVGAWKTVGAALAAAAIGAGGVVAKGMRQNSSIQEKLDQVVADVAQIRSDVRMLKCTAGFPGDCPGQAQHGP